MRPLGGSEAKHFRERGGPISPRELVATVPHRFFFPGVTGIAIVSLWWLWVLAARVTHAVPPPASPLPDMAVHALVMIYGFAPFFMFGFMFTAGPKWLHVAPPSPRAWRIPGAIAAWVACLVPWTLKYAPVYWRPRPDGRAG